jgi:hypothetical protein
MCATSHPRDSQTSPIFSHDADDCKIVGERGEMTSDNGFFVGMPTLTDP